ncbi:MAG: transposase, partial [Anaerolineae bacterium]|nr:transposase [Anaerolineae bacterium]
MLKLPEHIITLMQPFCPLFREPTWRKAQILLIGAILTTGARTVTACLRVMGLSQETDFAKYHQVLNRAIWSPRQASERLLKLLLRTLDQELKPLVFGLDETIERRWGRQIRARGIYRDPVRSSRSHFVKASGLRWLSLMWLTEIPWAKRVWALPILTVLAPSEGYYAGSARRHKTLLDWARQLIYQLRRWLPRRALIVVADNTYAALDLLHACQRLTNPVTMITRLRLDAALYKPAPAYSGVGRPRKKGARLPSLQAVLTHPKTRWQQIKVKWYDGQQRLMELTSHTAVWYHPGKPVVPIRWVLIRDPNGVYDPLALLCTQLDYSAVQIVNWFVRRWQIEVTFEEARRHLGLETQRQWSDKAIARTTPLLLGLFSWVTVLAHHLQQTQPVTVRQAAWYVKDRPTFADALSWVRWQLWQASLTFSMSDQDPDMVKIP